MPTADHFVLQTFPGTLWDIVVVVKRWTSHQENVIESTTYLQEHTQGGGGGGRIRGLNTPPPFGSKNNCCCLLVREVGDVQGYPYPCLEKTWPPPPKKKKKVSESPAQQLSQGWCCITACMQKTPPLKKSCVRHCIPGFLSPLQCQLVCQIYWHVRWVFSILLYIFRTRLPVQIDTYRVWLCWPQKPADQFCPANISRDIYETYLWFVKGEQVTTRDR